MSGGTLGRVINSVVPSLNIELVRDQEQLSRGAEACSTYHKSVVQQGAFRSTFCNYAEREARRTVIVQS